MKEFKLDDDVKVNENASNSALPAKKTAWDKVKGILFKEIDVKGFLFQEIDLNKPIKITVSPKTEKVFGEIHDFLFQEIKFPELHNFLFQEVNLFGSKKNKEQA